MMRGPTGKWIGRCDALSAWLPVHLGWLYGRALERMLDVAVRWCEMKAAEEYAGAARELRLYSGEPERVQRYALRRAEEASRWFSRKAVLLRAKEEIEGIR